MAVNSEYRDRRVTVMGLGRHGGGVAAARYLAKRGARVTVTDLLPEAALHASLDALADVAIHRFVLGEHRPSDFTATDLLVVNPAVRLDNPLVRQAIQHGVLVTSEIELFLDRCPAATIVGVTGSNGKSTTSVMLDRILRRAGRRCWLGGNIGRSLLPELETMTASDVVVLELSSFQLAWLSEGARWPDVAVITNCSPNHLDWHGSYAEYEAAKRRLVKHAGQVVLDPQANGLREWTRQSRSHSTNHLKLVADQHVPILAALGEHNRHNARLAATAAMTLGCTDGDFAALAEFSGLAHRQQLVAEFGGVRFVNDSKSTTAESTIAALRAMKRPTWLLLGGQSKGGDPARFAQLLHNARPLLRGIACFGAVSQPLSESLQAIMSMIAQIGDQNSALPLARFPTLAEGWRWCLAQSGPGETVLLSPGHASFDEFRDFAARGEFFCGLVASEVAKNQTRPTSLPQL